MAKKFLLQLILCFLMASTCGFGQGFTDVSVSAGTDFTHTGLPWFQDWQFGTGAAWFDFDQDGYLDFYVTNRNTHNKLFHNNGNGTFTEVAGAMGVNDPTGDGAGVVVGDINNDGYPDLFLANANEDKLYLNNSGTSFSDITASAGLLVTGDSRGTSGSFGDYNKDGYIDLFVAHHDVVPGSSNASIQDYLFLNNKDSTFTNVSSLIDSIHLADAAFIAAWTDYDLDNDLDIILITDCVFGDGPNLGTRVFRNDGGTDPINDWTFTEVRQTVLDDCSNGMGVGIGDYNRDGRMDLVYTDIGPAQLFRNDGLEFNDLTVPSGVGIQPFNHFSWGTSFLDFDNDAWQDIIIAIGDFNTIPPSDDKPNHLFKNNGNNTFTNVAQAMGVDDSLKSRTIVHGDYDNDGDLDLLVVNYGGAVRLMRNDISNSNNYLRVFLEGEGTTVGTRDALGAKIKVTTPDGVIQHFEMKSGTNLGGGDELCAHFGLGTNNLVTEVEVTWLSGQVSTLTNVSVNQAITMVEVLALPVELTDFLGEILDKKSLLKWTTASERNNDFFEIERSHDGVDFQKIGRVEGYGDSQDLVNYFFTDEHPLLGKNYYRLRQVDKDGSQHFSHTIILIHDFLQNEIKIFPNPTSGNKLLIQMWQGFQAPASFDFFDVNGKHIFQKNIDENFSEGNPIELWIPNLDNGIYMLRATDAFNTASSKVFIQR